MTLRDEVKQLQPKVEEMRIRAAGSGRQQTVRDALLFKIVKLLEQIEQNTRTR